MVPVQTQAHLKPSASTASTASAAFREPPASVVVRLRSAIARYPIPFITIVLLLVSGALAVAGQRDLARWPLALIIACGGVPLLIETGRQLWRRQVGVDVLALLAIVGALALGEWLAGAVIVLMLSGGQALEAFALSRAQRSLTALAERAPRLAHVVSNGELVTVPAEQVEVGQQVVVNPGEVVPVDGVVAEGSSSVSEADLTGEPTPQRKDLGGLILSGSVNLDTPLRVTAMKRSAESQYAQIVRLVEEAQRSKAPIHRLADRYAVWFTVLAVSLAALAWLASGRPVDALAVLVVATPCPLILATPIAIMSGIDRAAREGLITKSGAAIEGLGEAQVVVFDKTGTLTMGMPQVNEIIPIAALVDGVAGVAGVSPAPTLAGPAPLDEVVMLALAASVEQYSPHILARAVVDAARAHGTMLHAVTGAHEIAGKGIEGRVSVNDVNDLHEVHDAGGDTTTSLHVAVGNRTFMRQLAIALPERVVLEREQRAEKGQIVSFLAINGQVVALIVFADVPRPELALLVPGLKAAGIERTALLTGDGAVVGERIRKLAQIDEVVAQCLPAHKVAYVRDLEASGKRVVMVGDGVNDAPALASASVGIALGAQGLTAASAAADAVLLSPSILSVVSAIRLGRQVMRVARQGIFIGIGLSVVAMLFAATGHIAPTEGALLQEGIDALVILNALRAGREKSVRQELPAPEHAGSETALKE